MIALLFGIAVALCALKLSVEYIILLTLAVSSVILGVFSTFPQLGGTYGLIGIPLPTSSAGRCRIRVTGYSHSW